MHYYHLNSDLIKSVMQDETLHPADRVCKLAMISLWGADAPEKLKERTLLIGAAIDQANEEWEEKYGI